MKSKDVMLNWGGVATILSTTFTAIDGAKR